MLARILAAIRDVRQFFSRGEWTVRWLQLPRESSSLDQRGLVIVQIDGLSHIELQKALASGRMPFLQRLLDREHYRLNQLYSGLPSSTPAVQGELLYRKRCAVPAFGFRDHRDKVVKRMFHRSIAADVQNRLAEDSEGLLQGGSSYCNIYDGGADEAHFCASSLGWGDLFHPINPWRILLVGSFYSFAALRTVALLVIEFLLAVVEFFRGVSVREFWQELMMIPGRVVVSILMRELAVNGAIMDTVRGLPTIYINLLGYDEQAHRRGRDSRFAHWTLRGIDASIRRLWVMAHRSVARHYDVWVISDHGQEKTQPYLYVAGQEINESVQKAVDEILGSSNAPTDCEAEPSQVASTRAAWLSAGWMAAKLFGEVADQSRADQGEPQIAALGPLGHVYLNRESTFENRLAIADQLVRRYGVPMALVRDGNVRDALLAITEDADNVLPDESERLFEDHPFKAEVTDDLIELCMHPDAGDIVLSGWAPRLKPVTFPLQHGAHAGFGPIETSAFALLPSDVHANVRPGNYLRPEDLHDAAKEFLAETRAPRVSTSHAMTSQSSRNSFRILTYNVHACLGMDGLRSPKRIARVIAQSGADIVALQELDVARARSGHLHQAEEIARHLEMEFNFHPAWEVADEKYGDAILSRFPMRQIKIGQLPATKLKREPRGALWVEIDLPSGESIQVINTHLSIYPTERFHQAQALLQDGWLDEAWECGPTIMLGDFNATPSSRTYGLLAKRLNATTGQFAKPVSTWPSPKSLLCIDHIFTSIGDFECHSAKPVNSVKAMVASDHLPLIAELAVLDKEHSGSNSAMRQLAHG